MHPSGNQRPRERRSNEELEKWKTDRDESGPTRGEKTRGDEEGGCTWFC